MSEGGIEGTFKCGDCGAAVTWKDDLNDEDTVNCPGCGKPVGTLGQIKAVFFKKARAAAKAAARNAFKGFGKR